MTEKAVKMRGGMDAREEKLMQFMSTVWVLGRGEQKQRVKKKNTTRQTFCYQSFGQSFVAFQTDR